MACHFFQTGTKSSGREFGLVSAYWCASKLSTPQDNLLTKLS